MSGMAWLRRRSARAVGSLELADESVEQVAVGNDVAVAVFAPPLVVLGAGLAGEDI